MQCAYTKQNSMDSFLHLHYMRIAAFLIFFIVAVFQ